MALALLIILFLFGIVASAGLHALADAMGFWPFMAVGGLLVAATAVGGITYDRALARRLRR